MAAVLTDRRALLAGVAGVAGLVAGRAWAGSQPLPPPDPRRWDPPLPYREGFAAGPNGRVYCRLYPGGPPGAVPAILLHGGPAAGHRYLRPYAVLARDRPLLFYDQSGCGRSARPADLACYTAARYVDELEAVRARAGWPRIILIGHSWGAFLAVLYAARHPSRVAATVLAGGAARWRDYQLASERWLAELGPGALATVRRAEATGRTDDAAYGQVMRDYYARHLCRLAPFPAWLVAEGELLGRNPVYRALNGPSEFEMTGRFASLDLRAALSRQRSPTLVTCGEYDEGPPWAARSMVELLPDARLRIFSGLSHMTHVEAPITVAATTADFLRAALGGVG